MSRGMVSAEGTPGVAAAVVPALAERTSPASSAPEVATGIDAGAPEAPRQYSDPTPLFVRVFQRLGLNRPLPEFRVGFFPYAGLRSKIRLRGNVIEASLSDLLAGARPLVLEALAEILLSKLFRRRPSREARDCYVAFARSAAMTGRIEEVRRERGMKILRPPRGFFFDLQEIFDDLNRRYFRGELRVRCLGWSPVRSRTVLGHYDSAHSSITISRWLDLPRTPRYLVEYVVFHEMLHVVYPVERNGHRRVIHSAEFRAAERKFPKYEQARHKLKQLCVELG